VTSVMAFRGIVLEQPQDRAGRDNPPLFSDLNVGHASAAVAVDKAQNGPMRLPARRSLASRRRKTGTRRGRTWSSWHCADPAVGCGKSASPLAGTGRLQARYQTRRRFLGSGDNGWLRPSAEDGRIELGGGS